MRLLVFLLETVELSVLCGALRSTKRRPEESRAALEAEAGESGHRSCVVERVRTGEQQRFQDVEAIGRVLALMIVHASDEEQSGA